MYLQIHIYIIVIMIMHSSKILHLHVCYLCYNKNNNNIRPETKIIDPESSRTRRNVTAICLNKPSFHSEINYGHATSTVHFSHFPATYTNKKKQTKMRNHLYIVLFSFSSAFCYFSSLMRHISLVYLLPLLLLQ